MGEPSTLSARRRPTDGRLPRPGAPSWMSRTDPMGRWLGTLFCGGGVLALISLALPREFVGSTTLVAVVALVAFAIGVLLLAGALNGGAPSAFFLVSRARTFSSPSGPTCREPGERGGAVLSLGHPVRLCPVLADPGRSADHHASPSAGALSLVRLDERRPELGPPEPDEPQVDPRHRHGIAVGSSSASSSRSLRDVDRAASPAPSQTPGRSRVLVDRRSGWRSNDAFCRILGYTSERARSGAPAGRSPTATSSPRVTRRSPTSDNQVVEEEQKIWPDRSTVCLTVTASAPWSPKNFSDPYMFAQYQDISDREHRARRSSGTRPGPRSAHRPRRNRASADRATRRQRSPGGPAGGPASASVLLDLDNFEDRERLAGSTTSAIRCSSAILACDRRRMARRETFARPSSAADGSSLLCEEAVGRTRPGPGHAHLEAWHDSRARDGPVLPPAPASAVTVATKPGDDGTHCSREADAGM